MSASNTFISLNNIYFFPVHLVNKMFLVGWGLLGALEHLPISDRVLGSISCRGRGMRREEGSGPLNFGDLSSTKIQSKP